MDELLVGWQDPPSIYRGAPFWAWNDDLDPARLCRQIEQMRRAGMGGFFMHSRYGLKTPYLGQKWFACVSACVEKARELGMKAYLYDEDRWPSGAAGGIVTRHNPQFRQHFLDARFEPACDTQPGQHLASFAVRFNHARLLESHHRLQPGQQPPQGWESLTFRAGPRESSGWYNDGAYLDTMNPQAVAEFLRVTHEEYWARYQADFGGLIPAMFTDEPEYGKTQVLEGGLVHRIQWTPLLPEQFRRRRGYDLLEHLPELVCWLTDGEFSSVRYDYHRTMTELFLEAFSEPYGRWCADHNIAFTGHYMAEQTLGSQCDCIGAAMPHYEHQQWPGIDILRDSAEELATAKQCSSVADQLGRQRVLSELYGCTGWDWPLEGHKFIGDWQYAAGVNFRCQHLTWYSAAGGAKRDYPASIFSHSPWWKYYRSVEDYFGRLSVALTRGRAVRDVLVIHPIESGWGIFTSNRPDGSSLLQRLQEDLRNVIYSLSGEHYDWDFGDESLLAKHAKVASGRLKVGKMAYRLVVVPPSLTLRAGTVKLLRRLLGAGGKVLFVGLTPTRIEGRPADDLKDLIDAAGTCGHQPEQFVPAVEALLERRVSITEDGRQAACVWAMLRAVKGGRILFVQSHDRKSAHRLRFSVEGKTPVVLWDALTGHKQRLKSTRTPKGRAEFDVELPPSGSALLTLGLSVKDASAARKTPKVTARRSIQGPFEVELTEPNTLPLDYCRYRLGEEEFSAPVPTLKADAQIRRRFGLGDRLGRQHQPWYLYATGAVDTSPRGRCRISRQFHVTDLPAKCLLAIERPGDFQITVNGRPAGPVSGWWVDEDIRTIDVTPQLRVGDNELLLDFDYRPNIEIEDVYLVGDFGVSRRGDGRLDWQDVTLVAPPRRMAIGSWVGQGLDFYGGSVLYRLRLQKPSGRRRLRISLPGIACTAAAIHVNGRTFAMPWAPFEADVTDALGDGDNDVAIEVIGGRKNVLGPLHTPWGAWTGPGEFNPDHPKWTDEYLLTDHGLTAEPLVEILAT